MNIDNVFNAVGAAVKTAGDKVAGAKVDPNDQTSLINMQMDYQKWSIATQMQTNTLKMMGDALKGITSNMR